MKKAEEVKKEDDKIDIGIDLFDDGVSTSFTKNIVLTPSDAIRLFADLPKEHQFWTKDGKGLNNIEELYKELLIMDDSCFYHHVYDGNNDFANWVRDILKEPKLSVKMALLKTKDEHISILKRYMDFKKSMNSDTIIERPVFREDRREPIILGGGTPAKKIVKEEELPATKNEPMIIGGASTEKKDDVSISISKTDAAAKNENADKAIRTSSDSSIEKKIFYSGNDGFKATEPPILKKNIGPDDSLSEKNIKDEISERKSNIMNTISQLKQMEADILKKEKELEEKELEIERLELEFNKKESMIREKHAILQKKYEKKLTKI